MLLAQQQQRSTRNKIMRERAARPPASCRRRLHGIASSITVTRTELFPSSYKLHTSQLDFGAISFPAGRYHH